MLDATSDDATTTSALSVSDPFRALLMIADRFYSEIEMQRYLLERPSIITGWRDWSKDQRQVVIDKYLAAMRCT